MSKQMVHIINKQDSYNFFPRPLTQASDIEDMNVFKTFVIEVAEFDSSEYTLTLHNRSLNTLYELKGDAIIVGDYFRLHVSELDIPDGEYEYELNTFNIITSGMLRLGQLTTNNIHYDANIKYTTVDL